MKPKEAIREETWEIKRWNGSLIPRVRKEEYLIMSLWDRNQRNQMKEQQKVGGKAWRVLLSQRVCQQWIFIECWQTWNGQEGSYQEYQFGLVMHVDFLGLFILEWKETLLDFFFFSTIIIYCFLSSLTDHLCVAEPLASINQMSENSLRHADRSTQI